MIARRSSALVCAAALALGAMLRAEAMTIAVVTGNWPVEDQPAISVVSESVLFGKSTARKNVCVVPGLPVDTSLTFLVSQRAKWAYFTRTLRDADWEGPIVVARADTILPTVRSTVYGIGSDRSAGGLALIGLPPTDDDLDDQLTRLTALSAIHEPVVRDVVLWSLCSLEIAARDDPSRTERLRKWRLDNLHKPDAVAAWLNTGENNRRNNIYSYLAWADARDTDYRLDPNELVELVRDDGTLLPIRAAALRVCARHGVEFDQATWELVSREARNPESPLAYAANYACAKATDAGRRQVVLGGIRQADPWLYMAALKAAQDTKFEAATPVVLERVATLQTQAMKTVTIEYLGKQTGPGSAEGLMRFMDDSDIAVKARALAELQGWNSRPQGLPGNLKPQLRRFETMDLSNAIRRMPERGPY